MKDECGGVLRLVGSDAAGTTTEGGQGCQRAHPPVGNLRVSGSGRGFGRPASMRMVGNVRRLPSKIANAGEGQPPRRVASGLRTGRRIRAPVRRGGYRTTQSTPSRATDYADGHRFGPPCLPGNEPQISRMDTDLLLRAFVPACLRAFRRLVFPTAGAKDRKCGMVGGDWRFWAERGGPRLSVFSSQSSVLSPQSASARQPRRGART